MIGFSFFGHSLPSRFVYGFFTYFHNYTLPFYLRIVKGRENNSGEEYRQLESFIQAGADSVSDYVYTNLAPTPLARSRFCEESLETAIRTGTSQYGILGCGYDTFSLRNTHKNIRIFEIDKEQVISDKLSRIERAGFSVPENARFIPAELSKDSLRSVLEKHGFLIYEFLNLGEIQDRFFAECNNEMTAFENVNFAQAVLFDKR